MRGLAAALILTALFLTSCSFSRNREVEWAVPRNKMADLKWHLPSTPPRGAVLLLHGLNMDPVRMDAWGVSLAQQGLASLRVALTGHVDTEELATVTAEKWMIDIALGVEELRGRYPGLPRTVLCYSLSCPTLFHYFDTAKVQPFSRIVLVAPALAFTLKVTLTRFFVHLRIFGISLPSVAPKEVRATRWMPLQAYHALFELADGARKLENPELVREVPVLFVLAEDDELISARGIVKWISRNGLRNTQIERVGPDAFENSSAYQHLIGCLDILPERLQSHLVQRISHFLVPM